MSINTRRFIRGLMRSWTANAGVIMAVLGFMQTQQELISKYLGESATGIIMMLFGATVVALRAKTTESLSSKGAR